MATMVASAAPTLFEEASCDACGGAARKHLYAFPFGAEAAAIVRCAGCGLAYSSPRPKPQALGGFYGGDYYSFRKPSLPSVAVQASFKERLRRTIMARHFGYAHLGESAPLPRFVTAFLARFLVMPRYQEKGALLDVGCGSGERMLELQSFGWTVQGLEFSEEAANAGREAGLSIDVGDIESAPYAQASFTTISFYHSLEHVYSPSETLKSAFGLLQPGGELLVAVPNFGSGERKLFGKNWGWLQMPTHLYHFDKEALESCVAAAGFVDVQTRYSFHGYSVDTSIFGAFQKLAEPLLKVFALGSAVLSDGKALTLTAKKPKSGP